MTPAPLYLAFYTEGTPYELEAKELSETLRRFDLEQELVPVPSLGSWVHNCSQKPRVIRDAMLRHEGRPIVYLDADARLIQRPVLFDALPKDTDLAAHYLDGTELLSGTLYFGATAGAWELVKLWTKGCQDQPGVWDQRTLQDIVDGTKRFKIQYLPEEYVCIFDRGRVEPHNVVIEHGQASRKFRGLMGG